MLPTRSPGSEDKDLADPTYRLADWRVQTFGGKLRWLATVCAALGLGLFIWLLIEGEKAEIFFPVQLKGKTATWSVGAVAFIWLAIAAINWTALLKKKGMHGSKPPGS